jgi:hypothetical protein
MKKLSIFILSVLAVFGATAAESFLKVTPNLSSLLQAVVVTRIRPKTTNMVLKILILKIFYFYANKLSKRKYT